MRSTRRTRTRPTGYIEQRPVILIATEGEKTEPQYFNIFKKHNNNIQIRILPTRNGHSSPHAVKDRLKREIRENEITERDEAWVVIDIDNWTDSQLNAVFEWSNTKANYGFAVSNPLFEYWLLLHFDEGDNIGDKTDCINRLRICIPGYRKNRIRIGNFNRNNIEDAINRAKKKDNPPCTKWPDTIGSTVYRLVERLL